MEKMSMEKNSSSVDRAPSNRNELTAEQPPGDQEDSLL